MALSDAEKDARRVARHLKLAAAEYLAEGYTTHARAVAEQVATIKRGYAPHWRSIERFLDAADEGAAMADADARYRATSRDVAKHLRAALAR